ncbi:MAG: glycosyltransferase family 39 protein [Chloroflexota bacterium]|nr:glycosyltransferase family 39 protein [Chloroflexota bacterium]
MVTQSHSNRVPIKLVSLSLLIFLILALIYSVTTPLFEGFDEQWHFAYVQHIKTGQGLPRQPPEQYPHLARQEGSQPPLYYLTAAALTWWIPTDDFTIYLERNPKWGNIPWDYVDNLNYMLHRDTEQFPYRGTVLAVHIARWLSVLCGLGVAYNTYRLARLLFPSQLKPALAAMALVTFTPSFVFVAGLCSNDSMNALWASFVLVLLVQLWQQPTYKLTALLGLVLGLAALTKLSGLALWGLAGLVLLLIAWRQRSFNYLWRTTALTFALALLVSGWWYWRNLHLYGELTGVKMMLAVYERRAATFNLRDLYEELEKIRWSYWAIFGWFNVPVKQWMYYVYDLLSLLGGVGIIYTLGQTFWQRNWQKLLHYTYLLLWAGMIFASLLRWAWITTGSHGRLLHPAIGALSILLVQGWKALLPPSGWQRKFILIGIGTFLWGSSLYVPLVVIPAAYAPPPALTSAQATAQTTQQTEIHFADKLTLLGYAVQPDSVAPGEITWVTACWRGDQPLAEDYFVFIHLRTSDEIIISQKDTYHGLGNFPTSNWPTGIIFCDHYPLKTPITLPLSNPSTISMGVYRETGERLLPQNSAQQLSEVQFPGPQLVKDTFQKLEYNWSRQLGLLRYELPQTTVAPGEKLTITLHWHALTAPAANYVASLQLLDEEYNKIAQSDLQLRRQEQPTSAWQAGEELTEQRQLQISSEAPPGVYQLKVIVYEAQTQETLSLYRGQQLAGEPTLTLWKIRVLSE